MIKIHSVIHQSYSPTYLSTVIPTTDYAEVNPFAMGQFNSYTKKEGVTTLLYKILFDWKVLESNTIFGTKLEDKHYLHHLNGKVWDVHDLNPNYLSTRIDTHSLVNPFHPEVIEMIKQEKLKRIAEGYVGYRFDETTIPFTLFDPMDCLELKEISGRSRFAYYFRAWENIFTILKAWELDRDFVLWPSLYYFWNSLELRIARACNKNIFTEAFICGLGITANTKNISTLEQAKSVYGNSAFTFDANNVQVGISYSDLEANFIVMTALDWMKRNDYKFIFWSRFGYKLDWMNTYFKNNEVAINLDGLRYPNGYLPYWARSAFQET